MTRTASHVDRSELPDAERLKLLERDVGEIRQDVADMLAGEARRDDRLKTDTQSSISSAAVMMTAQGAMLKEHDAILKELRDNSRASAEERTKRVEKEKAAAEERAETTRKENRKFWLALLGVLATIAVPAIYAIAHVSPPAVEAPHEHEAPKPRE